MMADTRVKTTDERVLSLLRESQESARLGHIVAAIRSLDQAVEIDPCCAWAWAHRGDLRYQHLGQHQNAVGDFDRAIQLDPSYAWAFAHRGAAYERLDRFDNALEDFKRALELKPDYTWATAMLCRVYQFLGRYEDALAALENVVEQDATIFPHWREERGLMRMLAGRYEEADLFFRIAIEADPKDRFAHYNFTLNMFLWRGLEEARPHIHKLREELRSLIQTSPDSRVVDRSIYELGGLAALEGDTDQALRYLREAYNREQGLVLLSPARKRSRVDPAWATLRGHDRYREIFDPEN
ncbi:uncharacterized protein SOCE26_039510 [Sorangium cellulosum]|uniref:Tetratricopeptide repeat protein n=2 Tax=Sorangium cellulosum TaxID=56 RepID=A0A2L0ET82_SORCE|nr:uncharacterized protein SOCE26_039510 [Sorangium cellulosum]